MRSRIVPALVFITLLLFYAIAFRFGADRASDVFPTPRWWLERFPSLLSGAYSWFILGRLLVILVTGSVVGFACAKVFPVRPVGAAVAIGVLAFFLSQFEWLFRLGLVDGWIKARLCLDLIALVLIPAGATFGVRAVISNPSLERP
jgi:hypothetical protein